MPRGGKRPGAGRKPGLRLEPRAQSPIRAAEILLAESLPELVQIAVSMARDGDKQLLVYCIDRVLGRTVQPISIETQVEEIAAEFNVEPERVTSIVERLKAKRAS